MTTHPVVWFFPPAYDIDKWKLDFERGAVASRLPYGLENFRSPDRQQVIAVGSSPMRATERLRSVIPSLVRASGDASGVDVTWQESNLPRMLTQGCGRFRLCGVIWLTDPPSSWADRLQRFAQLRGLVALDGAWVLSRAQVAPLQRMMQNGARARFLRFGINEQFFRPTPYDAAQGVLSVGNDRHRDADTLISALGIVHEQMPDVPMRVQLRSDRALPTYIERLPRMTHGELRDEYARAAVVAVATRPNLHVSGMTVALEAGASARPVVITRTPGMADYVISGETGLTVPPGDASALAGRIMALLRDRTVAASMGVTARAKVEREHTEAAMMVALSEMVREVVDS